MVSNYFHMLIVEAATISLTTAEGPAALPDVIFFTLSHTMSAVI